MKLVDLFLEEIEDVHLKEFDKIEWEDVVRRAKKNQGKRFSRKEFDKYWDEYQDERMRRYLN